MSDSLNGPFTAPEDNVLDGSGFIFYAAKTAELDGKRFLCGWLGRAALPTDTGKYQWAGNVLNHQLIQLEDGRLGVQAPETYDTYFTNEKEFKAVKKQGKVSIKNNSISLSAGDDEVALADMGTRAPSMMLECDVKLDNDGCAGFAFGGSENDESYTAFCLDAAQSLLHYEGTDINELDQYPAEAYTHFVFSKKDVHHVKLVCENEIVVLYIDNEKALSSRVFHSVNGAHIGVFSQKGSTEFSNIKMMLN
jgi:beta-fructofuranosidase